MSFISNIFLWLLPLISIPLIIHILNRRKIIKVNFSSIRFLESLKSDSIKRINILQWLLLLIRTLIILSIILMISRPILKGYFPQMEVDPNSSLSIILIDDSFSLNGRENENERIELIKEKYKEILKSFNHKTKLCVISLSQGVLYEGINSNLPELSKLLSITNNQGELYSYINTINQKFDNSIINKEVFIITDGQANLFENISSNEISDWKLYFILLDKLESNLKINYAKILNSITVKDKIIDIEVEVENNGLKEVQNKMVNIFINKVNVGLKNVTIDSGKKEIILFSTVLPNYENNLIKISISEDDNNFDNEYYINAYVPYSINVLSIFNNPNNMEYVKNVINTTNKKNSIFNHTTVSYLDLTFADLNNYDVVIVYDYSILEFHYNFFEEYLSNNNHLVIFPEENNDLNQLYGIIGDVKDSYSYISLEDKSYEKTPYSYLMAENDKKVNINKEKFIKIFKYIEMPINSNSLMPIGELNSFWDKIYFGNSQTDIFYTSFHLSWNEFPIKGAFIQFINELIYSGYSSAAYNKSIGDRISFGVESANISSPIRCEDPNNNHYELIPNLGIVKSNILNQPGVYNFYNNNNIIYSAAVNIDTKELTSKILTDKEIESRLGIPCHFFNANQKISSSIIKSRQGYELWRYILWFLCSMIIIEMLISNGSRKP